MRLDFNNVERKQIKNCAKIKRITFHTLNIDEKVAKQTYCLLNAISAENITFLYKRVPICNRDKFI